MGDVIVTEVVPSRDPHTEFTVLFFTPYDSTGIALIASERGNTFRVKDPVVRGSRIKPKRSHELKLRGIYNITAGMEI